MYKIPRYHNSLIRCKRKFEGESIEGKVKRLMANKEPIKDGSPIIYTDRADGVNPAYNVRTDRWELATDAMDKISRQKEASKDGIGKIVKMKSDTKDSGAESIAGEADREVSQ
jgi:hypothetical protein